MATMLKEQDAKKEKKEKKKKKKDKDDASPEPCAEPDIEIQEKKEKKQARRASSCRRAPARDFRQVTFRERHQQARK